MLVRRFGKRGSKKKRRGEGERKKRGRKKDKKRASRNSKGQAGGGKKKKGNRKLACSSQCRAMALVSSSRVQVPETSRPKTAA